MKILHLSIIILIFLGFTGLMMSYDNTAHGIWIPESSHDLLEKSATIFVGNITATKVLQFEKQWSILESENGTDKTITGNYTLNLDEYTVNVEEYLKNPQNSTKITVSQPTIGIMARLGGLDRFKTGDHVLFYVEKLGGNNTYSPESFIIPTFCKANDVITQKRPEGGNEFNVTQNGIQVDYGNFTTNKPIQFLSSKDMNTLSGKSFDVTVGIAKNVGQGTEPVFSQEIHTKSKPCEWIASAEWEFTPKEGNYTMYVATKEGGIPTGESYTGFSVKSDTIPPHSMSPLKQFQSGISANNIICKEGLQLIIKETDGSPACVKSETSKILVERGWAMKEKRYHLYFPGSAPPIIDTRIAKIVSSTPEAESIVGYSVGIPSYLPVGYSIQSILVDNSNSSKFVKILVANFPVTQNTTSVEFMDKGGIMIYIEPTSPAFNQTNWTAGWLNQTLGSMPIKIAGYDGVINDITKGKRFDEDIDIPAELAVFRNGSMIEISGFVHSLELIKIAEGISIVETSDLSTHYCGKFYTVPENKTYLNTVPVLLMKSNSTACARLTFTINSNYKDCNGPNCQHIFSLASMLSIRNLHYEKNDGSFSITPGKDYTNSFKIIAVPDTVDLANYPLGA